MQIGRDLGVVRGDGAERLGGERLAELDRGGGELLELAHQARVVERARRHGDRRAVAGRSGQECDAADVDHLERLVDAVDAGADLGREGLDVDDDEVDQADAVLDELGELRRVVASGEDAGVDGGVEGLDLAADERRDLGQVADARDLDALACEVLACAVGRVDLDAEPEQLAGQRREAVAARDRDEGSHAACLRPVRLGFGTGVRAQGRGGTRRRGAGRHRAVRAPAPDGDRRGPKIGLRWAPRAFPGGEYSVRPWHTRPAALACEPVPATVERPPRPRAPVEDRITLGEP